MGKRRARLVQGDNPKLGDELRYKIAKTELDLHGKTVAQAERAVRRIITQPRWFGSSPAAGPTPKVSRYSGQPSKASWES
jgi:hypothetical protein